MKKINDQLLIDYLEKRLNESDQQSVDHWLKSDKNRAFLTQTEKIWRSSKNAAIYEKINVDESLLKIRTKTSHQIAKKSKERQLTIRAFMKIAAILTMVGVGIAIYLNPSSSKWITVSSNDATKEYQLPDGTLVTLNRTSTLKVSKDMRNRRIVELEGEAFFNVKRDETRPFIVNTRDIQVSVLGTSFNIQTDPNKTFVSVASGNVAVNSLKDLSHKLLLAKNESVTYNAEANELLKGMNHPNYLAWKTGVYSFENVAVEEVIQALANHNNIPVKFLNHGYIENCKITSVFENQSWKEIVDEISLLTLLEFTIKNDTTIIYGNSCKNSIDEK
jgi:transmembrane sensor